MSYRKISYSFEAQRLVIKMIIAFWNLTCAQQQWCWEACEIPEWWEHFKTISHGFEIRQDLVVRCLTAKWPEAVGKLWPTNFYSILNVLIQGSDFKWDRFWDKFRQTIFLWWGQDSNPGVPGNPTSSRLNEKLVRDVGLQPWIFEFLQLYCS